MSSGYSSPLAALAAITECLDGLCDRVHVGSLGSGAELACCPGCLLRIESAGLRVPDGLPRNLHTAARGCKPLVLDVVLNYRQCFQSMTQRGTVRPLAALTEDGIALVASWWGVLGIISCCAPLNQLTRFTSITDSPPEGGCAGWTMALEIDVSLCGCPPPGVGGTASPAAITVDVV